MDSYPIQPVAEVDDAEPFLREASAVLNFGSIQLCTVMDVGCGTGNSSYALASMFPNINHVIGVDVEEERLSIARRYCPPKRTFCDTIQFVRGNIETGEGLFQFRGIRHIVSIHCFSCLKRQGKAFEMMHTLLCPGGGAAILFAVQMDYYNCLSDLLNHPKWGQFMKNREDVIPESHDNLYEEDYYRQLLTEIGFQIHTCRKEESFHSYHDENNLRDWVYASLPFIRPLPPGLIPEFLQELSMILKRRIVENDQKGYKMYYKVMKIIVIKKESLEDEGIGSTANSNNTADYRTLVSNIF